MCGGKLCTNVWQLQLLQSLAPSVCFTDASRLAVSEAASPSGPLAVGPYKSARTVGPYSRTIQVGPYSRYKCARQPVMRCSRWKMETCGRCGGVQLRQGQLCGVGDRRWGRVALVRLNIQLVWHIYDGIIHSYTPPDDIWLFVVEIESNEINKHAYIDGLARQTTLFRRFIWSHNHLNESMIVKWSIDVLHTHRWSRWTVAWVLTVTGLSLDYPIIFIYLFKQLLVSRHNVNRTKNSYRRIAGADKPRDQPAQLSIYWIKLFFEARKTEGPAPKFSSRGQTLKESMRCWLQLSSRLVIVDQVGEIFLLIGLLTLIWQFYFFWGGGGKSTPRVIKGSITAKNKIPKITGSTYISAFRRIETPFKGYPHFQGRATL